MSLRLRLFLLIGGLVALLVLAQWWWVQTLTRDLSSELDEVASAVGKSVVKFFKEWKEPGDAWTECLGEACEDHPEAHGPDGDKIAHHQVKVIAFPEASKPGQRRVYSYETEQVTTRGGKDDVKSHVEIHVEHKDGDRFLWLGAPSLERRFQIPQQGMRDKLERFSRRSVLGSAGFLVLGLVLAGVVAHRVTSPLSRLCDAARRIGDGALGTRVPEPAAGEVGDAIRAFNQMSGRLEELDARSRELEARKHLGEIGEIARGLAHTLRNPLNALGLSVEELASRAGDDADPHLTDSARRQIRRIDHSIRSFLALASQSGGALTEIDLGELLEDVGLEALQNSRGKARLDLDVAEDLPRLSAVEPELRAVLQALVVNAVEASPEGGTVTVRAAAPEAGRWHLEIEDQGPGLAEDVRQRLFTPHLSTKANGSGMGLFLAHRIATTRYGGRLELVAPAAGGTRAVLELGERKAAPAEESGHG